ncbi:MAG: AgmX/PglI C-terminal domain-containing protein [Myxococcota bacterium]
MAFRDQVGVPDILLERYLADDLSPEQKRMVEVTLENTGEASDALRRRLDDFTREKAEFLAADPPDRFAHRLAARLAVDDEQAEAAPRARRWWAWILAPSAAAAATAVVTVVVTIVVRQTDAPGTGMTLQAPASRSEVAQPVVADPGVGEAMPDDAVTATPESRSLLRSKVKPRPARKRRKAKLAGYSADNAEEWAAGRRDAVGAKIAGKDAKTQAAAGVWIESPAPEPAPAAGEDAAPMSERVPAMLAPSPPAAVPMPSMPASRPAPKRRAKSKATSGGRSSSEELGAGLDAPGADVRGSLESSTVLALTKKHVSKLRTCIRASESRRELTAGTYELTLAWEITPSGRVIRARLVKPKSLQKSPLDKCMARRMAGWSYPASPEGTKVAGFPYSFEIAGTRRKNAPASTAR